MPFRVQFNQVPQITNLTTKTCNQSLIEKSLVNNKLKNDGIINDLVAATVVFEGAREIAKNVTEAVVGEKKFGGEFGAGTGDFFGLLDGGSRAGRVEGRGRRKIGGVGVRIRVRVWI